ASGLAAINAAAQAIKADEGDVFVAGGVESMTRAPYAIPKNQDGGMGNLTAWDTPLGWRFPNLRLKAQYGNEAMGETAENLREGKPTISREEQDRFALESHRRAIAAIESGKFAEEIVPVPLPSTTGEARTVSRDEPPRADTSLEALAKLRPAFREGGTVTAGNSSGINDGAAAVLLMSDRKARQLGLPPLVRIVSSAAAGVEPRTMGLGPIRASALEHSLQGSQRQLPDAVPIAGDGKGGAVDQMDERLRALRRELVDHARLRGPAFLRDRPHEGELSRAVDRGDRSLHPPLGQRPFIPPSILRLDPDVRGPPRRDLVGGHEGLEHEGEGTGDRHLDVREHDGVGGRRRGLLDCRLAGGRGRHAAAIRARVIMMLGPIVRADFCTARRRGGSPACIRGTCRAGTARGPARDGR